MEFNIERDRSPFTIAVTSPFHFFKAIKNKENVLEMDTVVSLRHYWEWNYYHFYFDVLGKLELLHIAGIDDSIPLVIANYADDVSFVHPLIERGKLGERTWLTPKTEYIRANKVIFCRTKRSCKERILYILDALNVETPKEEDGKRIYLDRSGTRQLKNLDEIKPVLEKHDFEIAYAGQMSIDEQISLFSNVRFIIANHGAGTTNILFRGENPLNLLEVHHEKLLNSDHRRICHDMGYSWDELGGKKEPGPPSRADFTVNPQQLEQKIVKLLNS